MPVLARRRAARPPRSYRSSPRARLQVYLHSLDVCYNGLVKGARAPGARVSDFDYLLFHSPYNKLVQKAAGRLLYNDFINNQVGAAAARAAFCTRSHHPERCTAHSTLLSRPLSRTGGGRARRRPRAVGGRCRFSLVDLHRPRARQGPQAGVGGRLQGQVRRWRVPLQADRQLVLERALRQPGGPRLDAGA